MPQQKMVKHEKCKVMPFEILKAREHIHDVTSSRVAAHVAACVLVLRIYPVFLTDFDIHGMLISTIFLHHFWNISQFVRSELKY